MTQEKCGNWRGKTGTWFAVLVILTLGIGLREWTWNHTGAIRIKGDYTNAWRWARQVVTDADKKAKTQPEISYPVACLTAYRDIYGRIDEYEPRREYKLDYPPLRLLTMSLWALWVEKAWPGIGQVGDAQLRPLLLINLLMELLAAVAAYGIVRFWTRKTENSPGPGLLCRGHAAGALAAGLVWFNPALILNAHAWPQWDGWVLPPFLFAVFAGLHRRWFTTGLLLAVGLFFKGQIAIVAPVFFIWAWARDGLKATGRLGGGFLTCSALAASPWLAGNLGMFSLVILGGAAAWLALRRKTEEIPWICAAAAAVFFLAGTLVPGSYLWLERGFLFGTQKYPQLYLGAAYNLPAVLSAGGWKLADTWAGVSLQAILRILYGMGMLLTGYAIAYYMKSRSALALAAVGFPWILMFALLGQMHERYLVWAAVATALGAVLSGRFLLLHLLISAGATAMMLTIMLPQGGGQWFPALQVLLRESHTWLAVFFSGIFALTAWRILVTPTVALARSAWAAMR